MGILSQSVKEFSTHYKNELPSFDKAEDIETYVEEVRLQRDKRSNKNYQKYEDGIDGFNASSLSIDDLIEELTKYQYRYCGVKETRLSLYKTYPNSNLYYEFISTFRSVDDSYPSYQFIYIPIEEQEKVIDLLPTVLIWDADNNYITYESPSTLYLKPLKIDLWPHYYSYISNNELIHPFLSSSFVFNGKMVEQGDGSILYEYIEVNNLYSSKGSVWVSTLRPQYLDFPYGIPQKDDLQYEECLLELIGSYPTKGTFPFIGGFTGYISTESYSKKKLFLYKRIDGSCFFSEERPHSFSKYLINYFSGGTLSISGARIKSVIRRKKKLHQLYLGIEANNSFFNKELFRVQTLVRLSNSNSLLGSVYSSKEHTYFLDGYKAGQSNNELSKEIFVSPLKTYNRLTLKLTSLFTVNNDYSSSFVENNIEPYRISNTYSSVFLELEKHLLSLPISLNLNYLEIGLSKYLAELYIYSTNSTLYLHNFNASYLISNVYFSNVDLETYDLNYKVATYSISSSPGMGGYRLIPTHKETYKEEYTFGIEINSLFIEIEVTFFSLSSKESNVTNLAIVPIYLFWDNQEVYWGDQQINWSE